MSPPVDRDAIVDALINTFRDNKWFVYDGGGNIEYYRVANELARAAIAALELTEERRTDLPGKRGINPQVRLVGPWVGQQGMNL